jgi:predicted phage terminase large subunit-like protein
MKKARRLTGTTPLLDWAKKYLSERIDSDFSKLHVLLAETVDGMKPGEKTCIIGPRESAKSTLGSLAYVLREALEGRESYIFLIGDTAKTSKVILERITEEIETNELLQQDYPESCGPLKGGKWNTEEIQLKNGCWIETAGTGQKIRGRLKKSRPSLIVTDDPQNNEHRYSSLKRSKTWDWYRSTVFRLGSNETKFLTLGTSLHREGIVDKLDKLPGWSTHRIPALISWPVNMTLWERWQDILNNPLKTMKENGEEAREFYEDNLDAMEEGAVVNWPAKKNLYTLMLMLAEMGRAAFESEEQAKPNNPDLCLFEQDWVDENILTKDFPVNGQIVTAVDPSLGKSDKASDYSAILTVNYIGGVFYVWADIRKRNVTDLIDDVIHYENRFSPLVVGIEENGFQSVIQDVMIARTENGEQIPIFPQGIKNYANKQQRIKRLTPLLARNRIRIVSNNCGSELLREQLADFPIGSHDDGPDALEMAIALFNFQNQEFYEEIGGQIQ